MNEVRRAVVHPAAGERLPETPELDEFPPLPLPEVTDDFSGNSPARKRVEYAQAVEEPELHLIGNVDPDEALRDQTKFSIIARHLFRNEKNEDIIDSLVEAGYPMHLRTLQRIMARSDFQEYYAKYRQTVLGPLDAEIRECMKQAMPEAFNQLVRVMRKGRDSAKLEAIRMIFEGGGAIKKETMNKRVNVNITGDQLERLLDIGRRVAEPSPPPMRLIESPSET